MKEDLLHFIWKHKKFPLDRLCTIGSESLVIKSVGVHNHLSGPDFFNSKVVIDGLLWAGNVEIHINSSDWYAHRHEQDPAYDSVILHVVWDDDVEVHRRDESVIPTLQLKDFVAPELLENYKVLFDHSKSSFINCDAGIQTISNFVMENWLERLYFERLEQKSVVIQQLLLDSQNNWEKVFFIMLLKNFGSTINGAIFYELGVNLDFNIIRKLIGKPHEMEALLFGLAGLLKNEERVDTYYSKLQETFLFLTNKFNLDTSVLQTSQFFKLRPSNFPTIRLSQLAAIYAAGNNLFQKCMAASTGEHANFLDATASEYWETHFNFGKISKKSKKSISQNLKNLIAINTIIPIKFCYLKTYGKEIDEAFFEPILNLKKEKNSIVANYEHLGVVVKNARESQALLQLHNSYCTKNKCLDCVVGNKLLNLKS